MKDEIAALGEEAALTAELVVRGVIVCSRLLTARFTQRSQR
jgi:hypothetical protein